MSQQQPLDKESRQWDVEGSKNPNSSIEREVKQLIIEIKNNTFNTGHNKFVAQFTQSRKNRTICSVRWLRKGTWWPKPYRPGKHRLSSCQGVDHLRPITDWPVKMYCYISPPKMYCYTLGQTVVALAHRYRQTTNNVDRELTELP